MPHKPYANRVEAGRVLAEVLTARGVPEGDGVVLALPPGGVPVAAPVAQALHAPLDVLPLRLLGLPGHREAVMGAVVAVGDDVVVVRDERVCDGARVPKAAFQAAVRRECDELQRRTVAWRGVRRPVPVRAKVVVVVHDGLASPRTVAAAVTAVRLRSPAHVVVAVPVAAAPSCAELAHRADEVVCPWSPPRLDCVGSCYDDFRQTSDEQVQAVLQDVGGPQHVAAAQ